MLCGFNSTYYCVQSVNNGTLRVLVEFIVQPDGSWSRNIIYQVSQGGVIALELAPKYERLNQFHYKTPTSIALENVAYLNKLYLIDESGILV